MKYKKKDLRDCPSADCSCPYWSWQLQKCTMYAEEQIEPKNECDEYFILGCE